MSSRPDCETKNEGEPGTFPGVGDVLEGRYELLRLIGQGGMGTVFQSRHLRLERDVAIKLMHRSLAVDSAFARRFEREVRITKDLVHVNSVRIYDFGVTDAGVMYLVMELLEGKELTEEIAEGPVAVGRIIELGQQLLDGLGEAHAMDVVHRDLKPGNIFLTRDRRGGEVVKVLDFGIAKSMESGATAITKANELIGTARYLAPEVFLDGEMSKQSDIYACALILLEMLYGRPLIDGESVFELVRRHIRTPVVVPDWLEEHPLVAIARRALAKNPAVRFPDAEAMFEALRNIPNRARIDRKVSEEEIAAVFDEVAEHAGKGFSIRSDAESDSAKKKSAVTVETKVERPDSGEVSGPEATTELLRDFVDRASREVSDYAEKVGDGSEDKTIQLDEGFIERAVADTRKMTREYGQTTGEKTVELSNARIEAAVKRGRETPSSGDAEELDPTIELSQSSVAEVRSDRSSVQESEEDRTIELTDDLLSQVEVSEEEGGGKETTRVELDQKLVEESETGSTMRGAAQSKHGGEGTMELTDDMVLEASVNLNAPTHEGETREPTGEIAMPREGTESKPNADREWRSPEKTQSRMFTGRHLRGFLIGAGLGLLALLLLYVLVQLVI